MRCLPLLALVACQVPYDVPRVPVDGGEYVAPEEGWRRAREELVKARACLADVPVYCLIDDELIDDAIQRDLDQHHHGHMPTNERWLTEHIGRARAEWNNEMKESPEQIEALVAANWAEPKVEMVKGRLDVWLYVPPSRLTLHNGHWKGESELVDRGELRSEVAVELLQRYGEEHPAAKVVRLVVDVPQPRKGFQRYDLRWYKARSEVVIYQPKRPVAHTTGEGADLLAYARGEAELSTRALSACPYDKYGDPPNCDGDASSVGGGKAKGKAKGRRRKKGGR
jgi:hypothetical protein